MAPYGSLLTARILIPFYGFTADPLNISELTAFNFRGRLSDP